MASNFRVTPLFVIALISVVGTSACYFLSDPPISIPTQEINSSRSFLDDQNCIQQACWHGLMPGISTVNDFIGLNILPEEIIRLPDEDNTDYITYQGNAENLDLSATFASDTQILELLVFTSTYSLTFQRTVERLGSPPRFFVGIQPTNNNRTSLLLGTVVLYYPEPGYVLTFYAGVQNDNVCVDGSETARRIEIHRPASQRPFTVIDSQMSIPQIGFPAEISRYPSWDGYGCFEPLN